MEWLNYHHLLYFWAVAKEGSVAKASEVLRLAQPTVSGQVKQLEHALGEQLFQRKGRNLVLTDTGELVFGYADEIFGLGRELMDSLRGRPSGRPGKLQVGISDVFPKLIAFRVLEVATALDPPVEIVCREDKTERLLAELSVHGFDLILTDTPFSGQVSVKAFNHLLGQSQVALYGVKKLADRYRRGFPESLEGAPLLLPTPHSVLRRAIDRWLDAHSIRPHIVAEFDDSALMKVFGAHGKGIFPGVTVIEEDIRRDFFARRIGLVEGVTEQFFAITLDRRIKHPAVQTISQAARESLFTNEDE
ncbi:MAG: transcriptional activator NhaR [Myxococcota bacterium]